MGKKLTNSMVEAFTGDGQVYTRGKFAGQLVEQPVLWDGELKGFGLRYAIKSGTRTYIMQCRVKGSKLERTITIGRHNNPWRVDQARSRALALKAQMTDGIDPVAEQQKKVDAKAAQAVLDVAQSATLREVRTHYLEHRRTKHGPLRQRTKDSIEETLDRTLPKWLDLPMAATVTRDACLERFTELSKATPGSANLTFVYLRSLVNHARELYASEDGTPTIFAINPITRMLKIRKLNREAPRTGRIPQDRIGAVWNMLQERRSSTHSDTVRAAADWLCVVMLTGTRLTESGSLQKGDIDLTANTVRLRGEVTKNHHELVLPLSTPLVEILRPRLDTPSTETAAERRRHRARSDMYVFPGFGIKRPYLTDPRATLDAVSKVAGVAISTHDLRRTYEDVLRYAKVDPDERRLILNHIGGDVHSVSYSNSKDPEALRPAMQAAAQWVLDQAIIAGTPNIVQFPGAKRA